MAQNNPIATGHAGGATAPMAALPAIEAELHARRLYENNCGPFEFEHTGDDVGPFVAREVAS